MKILVTGGAGFIGSAVVRQAIGDHGHHVVNVDKLTYAANLDNVASVAELPEHAFEQVDICDRIAIGEVFAKHQPDCVMHLAAESHVDRSIDGPGDFIATNITGTFVMLEATRAYWSGLIDSRKAAFRFHHVSTDEVFGSLGETGAFTETTPYAPNSPYSASKASSDMLVRAWGQTYGLPVLISNCSNNYGPFQFPEKLIPVVIQAAIEGRPIPIYGAGTNVRDWLHVEDHASALLTILTNGRPDETYNVGGNAEAQNIELVRLICSKLDTARPDPAGPYARLITHVTDRPGHDHRYAIDASKIARELGWTPTYTLDQGIEATIDWYLNADSWWSGLRARGVKTGRLGLSTGASA